jgi:hypothetical protein
MTIKEQVIEEAVRILNLHSCYPRVAVEEALKLDFYQECDKSDKLTWEDFYEVIEAVKNRTSFPAKQTKTCSNCGSDAELDPQCGAYVCTVCENHEGLARCFCGWSLSGDDGRQELIDMGEQIDEDF